MGLRAPANRAQGHPLNLQRLVLLGVAEVPRLDDPALRSVDVLFVLDVLNADAHAVLCEDDVLLAHALRGRLAELVGGEVDLVEDPADAGEDDEGDDEGEELSACEAKVSETVDAVGGEGRGWGAAEQSRAAQSRAAQSSGRSCAPALARRAQAGWVDGHSPDG